MLEFMPLLKNENNKLTFIVGTERVYAFSIRFFDPENIHCYLENDTGSALELTRDTDFTVEAKEDYTYGANVTLLLTPLPEGKRLTILRRMPLTQDLSLPTAGKLDTENLTRQLIRTTMQIQQIAEETSRAVKVLPGAAGSPDELLSSIDASVEQAGQYAAAAAAQVELAEEQVTAAAAQVELAEEQVTAAAAQVELAEGQVAAATEQAGASAASAQASAESAARAEQISSNWIMPENPRHNDVLIYKGTIDSLIGNDANTLVLCQFNGDTDNVAVGRASVPGISGGAITGNPYTLTVAANAGIDAVNRKFGQGALYLPPESPGGRRVFSVERIGARENGVDLPVSEWDSATLSVQISFFFRFETMSLQTFDAPLIVLGGYSGSVRTQYTLGVVNVSGDPRLGFIDYNDEKFSGDVLEAETWYNCQILVFSGGTTCVYLNGARFWTGASRPLKNCAYIDFVTGASGLWIDEFRVQRPAGAVLAGGKTIPVQLAEYSSGAPSRCAENQWVLASLAELRKRCGYWSCEAVANPITELGKPLAIPYGIPLSTLMLPELFDLCCPTATARLRCVTANNGYYPGEYARGVALRTAAGGEMPALPVVTLWTGEGDDEVYVLVEMMASGAGGLSILSLTGALITLTTVAALANWEWVITIKN